MVYPFCFGYLSKVVSAKDMFNKQMAEFAENNLI